MEKKTRQVHLLTYFILSLFAMDSLLKVFTLERITLLGSLYSLLFTITISSLTYAICNLFRKTSKGYLYVFFMIFYSLLFSSQLIYYKCFKTYYSLYSLSRGSQVIEFWRDILGLISSNLILILVFFVPSFFLLRFKNNFVFQQDRRMGFISLLFVLLFHIISLATLYMGGTDVTSSFHLYFQGNHPAQSIEKFGLLTTMRLDLQKLAFGSPHFLEATPSLPEFSKVQANEIKKEIRYNTMDIDFKTLIAGENTKDIKNMHQYFSTIAPTNQNDYTGIYKGYNLIFITAEAFSPYAVRPDETPTLYKMVHEGYYFSDFYNPLWGVSTSDGEYVASTGLLPKSGVWSFYESGKNFMPFALGNQLKKLGYKTMAYHNHTYDYYKRNISHPNMGYDYKGVGNGLKIKKVWPGSDLEMMEKTVDEYIKNQPFHAYYMTVSGHLRYSFTGNSMAAKNKKLVQNLPYSDESKAYIAAQIELDRALEYLLSRLEEAGIADKTLIVLSPDHYPYGLNQKSIDELAGHKVEKNFELYKSNLILYTKGMKPTEIHKPCSSADILPTVSNLFGLEYDSRLLIGRDIFSDEDPLVIFSNRSFITDKGRYNGETNKFTAVDETKIHETYLKEISAKVEQSFYYSQKILETNYYKKVLQRK